MATAFVAVLATLGLGATFGPRTVRVSNLIINTERNVHSPETRSEAHCGPAFIDAWRRPSDGWFGYAPNTTVTFAPPHAQCATGARAQLAVGIILIAAGGIGAWLLLRPPDPFPNLL